METGYEEDKRFDGTFEEFEYLMNCLGIEELFIQEGVTYRSAGTRKDVKPSYFKKYFDKRQAIFITYYVNGEVEVKVI